MRFVIPSFTPPDTFADNVAMTLRAMGHDVATLPTVSNTLFDWLPMRRIRELPARFNPQRPSLTERWLVKTARGKRADVVLSLTGSLTDETLFALKKLGTRCVAWWADAPGNMVRMGLLSDAWDIIYFKDAHAVEKFRRVGLNAHLLHEAMNPHWHRPIAEQSTNAVVIAGNFYGYRQFLALRLMRAGVTMELYGGRLPRWTHPDIARIHSRRYIVREEKSRIFGSALACLNSTAMIEGNSLNCRTFEIAGAGGLQLLEHRPMVEECFEPGKELMTFRTLDELLSQIEWASRNQAGARAVRRAGAERARAHHTYQQRLDRIIADLT